MLTKEQALVASEFHYGECRRLEGPRGGVKDRVEVWRRNGTTQTWKRRPDAFRVPIAHGLYSYGQIHDYDAHLWHTSDDCPMRKAAANA